ncbi:hypothetical protein IWQ56_003998, partial [Coemansia nantahalensis]
MVKAVLILGMALAASASSFHGYHRNPRTGVKPFGPAARGPAHYTVYSTPVAVAPEGVAKRQLRTT